AARPAGRRQGNPGQADLRGVRHPAHRHRGHPACSDGGGHGARPQGEADLRRGRARPGRHHDRANSRAPVRRRRGQRVRSRRLPGRPAGRGGLRGDPEGAGAGRGAPVIIRKSPQEIERMARAGEVVADVLALLGERARPGVTTEELDALADEFICSRGGSATFKGYRGYPASICTSPNDMVVHGIPGPYPLSDGDILSVDVGVTLDGFVADSAYTFPIGEISGEAERLLEGCKTALAAGIELWRPGCRLSDISQAIQAVTEEHGFSVVRSLVGHGVGRSMHEEPQIPNFGEPGRGPLLSAGMTFA